MHPQTSVGYDSKQSQSPSVAVRTALFMYAVLLAFDLSYGSINQGPYYFLAAIIFSWAGRRKNPVRPLVLLPIWLNAVLDSAGNIYGFYDTVAWFDDITHALGAASITIFLFPFIRTWLRLSSAATTGIVAVMAASSIGAFYEVGELWVEELSGIRILGGPKDAPQDLQWNTVGALIAFAVLLLNDKRRS